MFYNGYVKKHWFSQNGRLDWHKNGQNQRNVPTCIEKKFLFFWFTVNVVKIAFNKKTLIFSKMVD